MKKIDTSELAMMDFLVEFHRIAQTGVHGVAGKVKKAGFDISTDGKYHETRRHKRLCFVLIKFEKQKSLFGKEEFARIRKLEYIREVFMNTLERSGYTPTFTVKNAVELIIKVPIEE